jgi:5'-nucleotidase (lipoprotein e(P4) family)
MLIDSSKSFNYDSWSKWVNKKIATAIPGSLDFLNYANSRNIELIYLSNRKVENYNPTKENLISLGFPFNDGTLMLLMDETTDKTKRRNSLSEYEIIMLLGDNLSDFNSVYHKKSNKERIKNVDSLSHLFGEKFIVLPNLIYGAWEQGFE